jgi:hypothetical protein
MKKTLLITILLVQLQALAQNDTCKITEISADKNGTLNWTTEKESLKKPFVIEVWRWNKWLKVGEVFAHGTPNATQYRFNTLPHHGQNKVRVWMINDHYVCDSTTFVSAKPAVTFEAKDKMVQFSAETLYELVDSKGVSVKRGYSKEIICKDLAGTYTLYYDNKIKQLSF